MIDNINFVIPEIFISISLMFLLILGVFKKKSSSTVYNLSIVTLFILLTLIFTLPSNNIIKLFNNSFIIDPLSTYMKLILISSGIFVMLTSSKYLKIIKIYKIEYPILI